MVVEWMKSINFEGKYWILKEKKSIHKMQEISDDESGSE